MPDTLDLNILELSRQNLAELLDEQIATSSRLSLKDVGNPGYIAFY